MSRSSRLDGRQHMHSSHSPLQLDSRHAEAARNHPLTVPSDSDLEHTSASSSDPAVKSPDDPDPSLYKHQRHPSHSPFPAGLASIPQEPPDSSTTLPSSRVRVPSEPAWTSVHASTHGQVVPDMLASSIHRRPPVLAPRSPSDDNAGQKRTAAGVAKGLSDTSGVAHVGVGVERRRSRSIGSLSRESKIAALSVHLRTRLSYAAAKIEKNRKTHTHGHSRSPSTDSPIKIEHLVSLGEPETQQLVALNPPPTSHTHPLNGPARLSPVAWSAEASPSPPDPKPHLPVQARPKLAPPADIIASAGSSSSRRRRPNPNEVTKPTHFPPFLHRRHHSQQEFGVSRPAANLERVLVPGTPPLRPSSQNTSTPTPTPTPYNGSSAMEQDAIETLLFMSSPGHSHSGYHSSQPSQRHLPFQSSSDSRGSDARVPCSQDSHVGADHGRPVYGFRGQSIGLEAQAGDEIDRMLDQMDSDSDDEFEGGSGE